MYFIWKDDGDIIHDSNATTKEAKLIYENLYASWENEIVKSDNRNLINIQSLSQEQSNNLEGLIATMLDRKYCKHLNAWRMMKVLLLMATHLRSLSSFLRI